MLLRRGEIFVEIHGMLRIKVLTEAKKNQLQEKHL